MLIIINVNCQLMLIIMRIAKQVAHCATLKKVAAIVAETIAATCLAIILAVARHVTLLQWFVQLVLHEKLHNEAIPSS